MREQDLRYTEFECPECGCIGTLMVNLVEKDVTPRDSLPTLVTQVRFGCVDVHELRGAEAEEYLARALPGRSA